MMADHDKLWIREQTGVDVTIYVGLIVVTFFMLALSPFTTSVRLLFVKMDSLNPSTVN